MIFLVLPEDKNGVIFKVKSRFLEDLLLIRYNSLMRSIYPKTTWRLLLSKPHSGAMNMALDMAILSAVGREEVFPTLRLYSWIPPCISLGYSQPITDLDQNEIQSQGWEIVRRPTGGRAILHTDRAVLDFASV